MLSAENHAWFNQQTEIEQARLNSIFQKYKLGVLEIHNGTVIQGQAITLETELDEYDVIPLKVDDREYNRTRIKRETRQALEEYYKQGEDDGRK